MVGLIDFGTAWPADRRGMNSEGLQPQNAQLAFVRSSGTSIELIVDHREQWVGEPLIETAFELWRLRESIQP